LEKFFGSFPMIGKNFRDGFEKQKEQKGQQNKRRTKRSDNFDNSRQWCSTLKAKKTASRTGTLGERMGGDNLDNEGQLAPSGRNNCGREAGGNGRDAR
jgi:hypothetical protein